MVNIFIYAAMLDALGIIIFSLTFPLALCGPGQSYYNCIGRQYHNHERWLNDRVYTQWKFSQFLWCLFYLKNNEYYNRTLLSNARRIFHTAAFSSDYLLVVRILSAHSLSFMNAPRECGINAAFQKRFNHP